MRSISDFDQAVQHLIKAAKDRDPVDPFGDPLDDFEFLQAQRDRLVFHDLGRIQQRTRRRGFLAAADCVGFRRLAGSTTCARNGRRLFAVSRQEKKQSNDADRLRKYLARFGLSFEDLRGGATASSRLDFDRRDV